MRDRYVERDGDAYAIKLRANLPPGPAWPRRSDTRMGRYLRGLAALWERVAQATGVLLKREADPRTTQDMLDDWEAAFGLPDECRVEPQSDDERRTRLVEKMTSKGGQRPADFIALATVLGYPTITITEFSPFTCARSRCGTATAPKMGHPSIRYVWLVTLPGSQGTWFRAGTAGGGRCGRDPQLKWDHAEELECVFRKRKPAHTKVIFAYTGVLS